MIDAMYVIPWLTAACYYLGARAVITSWLWSRYPPAFDSFMSCSACSGFWYGMACAAVCVVEGHPCFGTTAWWIVPIVGLMAIVWTPLIASLHEAALEKLSSSGQSSE